MPLFLFCIQREVKERQQQQHCMKAKLRERRQQSARARRYYDEYTLQMRSKMLKKRTKEELVSQFRCWFFMFSFLALNVLM